MIHYSTNWMGPVSNGWYDARQIPSVLKKAVGWKGNTYEYKEYLEKYSCGRIDIYGLDPEEYWGGKHEYSLAPMRTEDWEELSEWLYDLESEELLSYGELIGNFEKKNGKIRWAPE